MRSKDSSTETHPGCDTVVEGEGGRRRRRPTSVSIGRVRETDYSVQTNGKNG